MCVMADPPEPLEERPARRAARELMSEEFLDQLMARVDDGDLSLTGAGGFLPELVRAVLERGLDAELSDHLGYERGDPAAAAFPNSRNGSTPKTLQTEVGAVDLDTPRDRAGNFEPRLVPKGSRRLGGLDEMIISLYAGGMTVRDIQHHLARTLGTELSHEAISNITDAVLDEVAEWQTRPLEEVYPIVYLDALVVKVRDNHQVRNRSAHIAVGVDCEGVKHVLGIWVQAAEGARFWGGVCAELRNRGVRDILIACCDGLHWASRGDRGHLAPDHGADLHRAPDPGIDAVRGLRRPQGRGPRAATHLHRCHRRGSSHRADEFTDSELGRKYPATAATWQTAWERFIPFLEFPPEVRRIIYTTNASSR